MAHGKLPKDVDLGTPFGRWLQLAVLRILIKGIARLKISGLEHVPPAGPLIVIINHIAFLDPMMIAGYVPRRTIPMAKAEAFKTPVWRWLMNIYGTIPVHRGEVDVHAVKTALRILKHGGAILMAPEGTRSPTYQLQPAKDGMAILALRSGAQIVPVGITGTHLVRHHLKKLRRAPIHLSIGKPFRLKSSTGPAKVSREEMTAITTQMMGRLAAQLPPEFRGVYRETEELTDTFLVPVGIN